MNQILFTNNNINGNRFDIRKIIIIFCAIIIVVALFALSLGAYRLYNNIQNRKKLAKPEITITRIATDQISLKISCQDGLDYVIYKWNETEDNKVALNGKTFFERQIDIPYNKNNTLKIETESVNKIKTMATQEFELEVDEEKPSIDSIATSGSVLNIEASDNSGIDYLEYQWENGDKKRVEANLEDNKALKTKIDIERGTHKLIISVTDIHGNKEEISRLVTGVNEPEIKVIKYNNVISITLTHDIGIKQANVLVNDKLYTYDESSPTYSNSTTVDLEYPLKEGENIIKIIAYSLEKLSEDGGDSLNNYSYKTYVGKCTYNAGE